MQETVSYSFLCTFFNQHILISTLVLHLTQGLCNTREAKLQGNEYQRIEKKDCASKQILNPKLIRNL